MSPLWKSQKTSSSRGAGQTACVGEFQARRPACTNFGGKPKNKYRAHASQKATSTPTRSAQRARRLRDAVNDQPMRTPATKKVLAQRPSRLIGTSEEVPCRWTGALCVIRVPSAPWSPAMPRGTARKTQGGTHNPDYVNPRALRSRARDSECGERYLRETTNHRESSGTGPNRLVGTSEEVLCGWIGAS